MSSPAPVLLRPRHEWICPSCGLQHVTHEHLPHVPMHPCRSLKGVIAPFVSTLEHRRSRHVVVEREDYVGDERVQLSPDGRPVMAVLTERADGSNDTHVFAPAATNSREPS